MSTIGAIAIDPWPMIVFNAIVAWFALFRARRASAKTDSILELASVDPTTEHHEWRPIGEVRDALVEVLNANGPSTVRELTSPNSTDLVGTPVQRYLVLVQMANTRQVKVGGGMILSAPVRLRDRPSADASRQSNAASKQRPARF